MAKFRPVKAREGLTDSLADAQRETGESARQAGQLGVRFRGEGLERFEGDLPCGSFEQLQVHLTLARLKLLRGYDELLCLEGLSGVDHLPHQIETVRRVLRRFHGRVLLADEVGLGKTIEACLLLREYLLRGVVRRVLILVPSPLVSQWEGELAEKFHLDFTVPPRTGASSRPEFWQSTDRVLVSLPFAKSDRRAAAVIAASWDLVIVDEAHHCKNRNTKNWQLINSLRRRFMFLLTATPVQNNLIELYSLLTLLEPGHLKTESEFKRQFITRGNPRDPRNRERLRSLLGEVMIRNTRSAVQIELPPRYAQTILAHPNGSEAELYSRVMNLLRRIAAERKSGGPSDDAGQPATWELESPRAAAAMSRMKLQSLLQSLGSHPQALAAALRSQPDSDGEVDQLRRLAGAVSLSAKDSKLLELLRQSQSHKVLVFVTHEHIAFSTFSGEQSAAEKDAAVDQLRTTVDVMLCTDCGGEGRNLQFADTLINYDLPWNPMRIEQRIGRVHRYGQTQDVYIFNLCTEGSLEARILRILNDKIRMFELVVGEVGSILGNLDEAQEFEALVLNMWIKAEDDRQLDEQFAQLGETLVEAQERYVAAKELDDALFGEDFQ
jgi:SNF2 family DNA or RNA helicase